MVPVRPEDPVGAIGACWATHHRATSRELGHLGALAGFAAVALANVALVGELRQAIEARDTFFERFERAVPTRHCGGFGLGLWLVRQTVEAHGGRVEVSSAPGQGSTFTVELPLR